MRGWKAKFVFLLMVYFAGFATAIYCLMPAPEAQMSGESSEHSAARAEQFAQSFNVGMHKCLEVAKDVTLEASRLIKQKLDERRAERQANNQTEPRQSYREDY
jgi:hypothetical protein